MKEKSQTGNTAWSPSCHYPIYLATGTVAKQLDATFSTSAKLDILSVDFSQPGMSMECVGSIESEHRYECSVVKPYNRVTIGTNNMVSI